MGEILAMYRITLTPMSHSDQSESEPILDLIIERMNLSLFMAKLAEAVNAAMKSRYK